MSRPLVLMTRRAARADGNAAVLVRQENAVTAHRVDDMTRRADGNAAVLVRQENAATANRANDTELLFLLLLAATMPCS